MARPREFDETTVLEAAMNCFWAQGFEQTSVRDLAELWAQQMDREPLLGALDAQFPGVGNDRGAMREQGGATLTEPGDARSDRVSRVSRCRRGLDDPAVVGNDVGERPSGIYADPHRPSVSDHTLTRRPNPRRYEAHTEVVCRR